MLFYCGMSNKLQEHFTHDVSVAEVQLKLAIFASSFVSCFEIDLLCGPKKSSKGVVC